MFSKPFVLAIAGLGCLGAAGAGGYLAVRMNTTERPLAAATLTPAAPEPTYATSVAVPEPTPAPAAVVDEPKPEPVRKSTLPAPRVIPRQPAPVRREVPASSQPATVASPPVAQSAPSASVSTARTETPAAQTATASDARQQAAESRRTRFEEVTIAEDSVIGIRLETPLSSETARIEDRITARVSRDVTVNGRTAIPAGAELEGTVTTVERGGKFRERARLGVRFTTLVLADATRVPIQTEAIFREGDSPTKEATTKIGASAAVGAIVGAIVGGKKGAVIGGSAGAAGGTGAVMAGDRHEATLTAGAPLTVRLTAPVNVLIERQ